MLISERSALAIAPNNINPMGINAPVKAVCSAVCLYSDECE